MFCQCGLKSQTVLENWVPLPFYSWNRTEQWISQPFLSGSQSPWNDFNNFQIFIKLPMFDWDRAICVLLQGQNQLLVPSGWGKARKTSRNPSHCHIKSIKSTSKRSQKTKLKTCPRHFLETLISCRIYISKNAILRVNPLETSLQFWLLLSVCYLCSL